jgi:hypothetical protein
MRVDLSSGTASPCLTMEASSMSKESPSRDSSNFRSLLSTPMSKESPSRDSSNFRSLLSTPMMLSRHDHVLPAASLPSPPRKSLCPDTSAQASLFNAPPLARLAWGDVTAQNHAHSKRLLLQRQTRRCSTQACVSLGVWGLGLGFRVWSLGFGV